jgi:RIO kinase 2
LIGLQRVAETVKHLDSEEVKVLLALEALTHRFEYAPLEEIITKSAIEADGVLFRIGHLNKLRLAQRSMERYQGYKITQAGYDVLALHELAARDIVVSIARPYGVGKEASVYHGMDSEGREVAVKFLRWGRTSFRQAQRLRGVPDSTVHSWMEYCKQAAEREYSGLRILTEKGVRVPQAIAMNRHVLVMSHIEGELLLRFTKLANPGRVVDRILQQVRAAYQDAQMVHGDLSEYNIFIDQDEQVILFDWPQWQPNSHPNALWLLKRDVRNVLKFFDRRFGLAYDLESALSRILEAPSQEANR